MGCRKIYAAMVRSANEVRFILLHFGADLRYSLQINGQGTLASIDGRHPEPIDPLGKKGSCLGRQTDEGRQIF